MPAHAQQMEKAKTYLGAADFGNMYEAKILQAMSDVDQRQKCGSETYLEVLETALINANAAARLAGGRGMVLEIQPSATT